MFTKLKRHIINRLAESISWRLKDDLLPHIKSTIKDNFAEYKTALIYDLSAEDFNVSTYADKYDLSILDSFRVSVSNVPENCTTNPIGVVTNKDFRGAGTYEDPFEIDLSWISLVKAINNANDGFVMCELGAGEGVWMLNAAFMAKQKGLDYNLIGVEAEPTHYRYIHEHLVTNAIPSDKYELIEAAVSDKGNETVTFAVGRPNEWYGQSIVTTEQAQLYETIEIRTITLDEILRKHDVFDFLHFDIQGYEYKVLSSTDKKTLNNKVKKIFIGTHGKQIENDLRFLFNKLGWVNEYDFETGSSVTVKGRICTFIDGIQSWVNPNI
jgi:FkbM family methyltransferase